jgi:hypothetical protein
MSIFFQGIGIDISDEIPAKAKKPIRKTASKANKAVASPASSLASSPGLQIVSSPTPRSPLPHQSPSRLTSHDQSVAGPSSLLKSLLTKSVVNNPAVPSTSSGFAFPPGFVILFSFLYVTRSLLNAYGICEIGLLKPESLITLLYVLKIFSRYEK